jgi:hypothetical protein
MGIPEGEDIDISLLEHVSPIEWENVILYGQYVLIPLPQLCTSADKRLVAGRPPQRRWCITWPQFDPGL